MGPWREQVAAAVDKLTAARAVPQQSQELAQPDAQLVLWQQWSSTF